MKKVRIFEELTAWVHQDDEFSQIPLKPLRMDFYNLSIWKYNEAWQLLKFIIIIELKDEGISRV